MDDEAKPKQLLEVVLFPAKPDTPPRYVTARLRALKKLHPTVEMRPIAPQTTEGAVKPEAFIVFSDFWGWGFWA